jgi:arylsulfatase A-like enzyme
VRQLKIARGTAVFVTALLALALTPARGERSGPAAPNTAAVSTPDTPAAPNIVLILTDDQRWDTLWAMPIVQSELVAHGVSFSNAMVVNSLCCPSRATILTGQYSHATGVYGNSGPYGGVHAFDDESTIATWLQGSGYHTGLIGKYLNEYDGLYIPPGWDRWVAFRGAPNGGAYYDYVLNEDGRAVSFGHEDADYSTDVLAGEADAFIRSAPADQPFFLYFAPFAPHVPYTPATVYENRFRHLEPYRPPNYNEADLSDKPAWVQHLPLLPPRKQKKIDGERRKQYQDLLSVDDAVGAIMAALSETGRLGDTLIAFTSDNGMSIGEHRWNNKKVAWEESIRVPMVVRYDPLTPSPRNDDHLVANLDLAPTFASAAGADAPLAEGLDMMTLLADPEAPWRGDMLIEHLHDRGDSAEGSPSPAQVPTFCAIRDDRLQPEGYAYTVYATGEEELYDLKADFYELTNVADDPGYALVKEDLRAVAKQLCDPPPPGFEWPYAEENRPTGARR